MIFDIEFPYKCSYFELLFQPAKMASETVTRPIRESNYCSLAFHAVNRKENEQ